MKLEAASVYAPVPNSVKKLGTQKSTGQKSVVLVGGQQLEKGGEAVKMDNIGVLNLEENPLESLPREEQKEDEDKENEPLALSGSPKQLK